MPARQPDFRRRIWVTPVAASFTRFPTVFPVDPQFPSQAERYLNRRRQTWPGLWSPVRVWPLLRRSWKTENRLLTERDAHEY
jgi:hypothetical protein